MARKSKLEKLLEETLFILEVVGIPLDGLTKRRKERIGKVFLSIAAVKPGMAWTDARADHRLRTREIITWVNANLGERISPGSYDDIRREDLKFPVAAGIVLARAGNETASTNDGTRRYALSEEMADLLHSFGTSQWDVSLIGFLGGRETLAEQLKRNRKQVLLPVMIDGQQLFFGPGEHNQLQKAIIEEFLPRFGHAPEVLYVGDTDDKLLFVKEQRLKELGFFELSHEKLPDVLAYSAKKNWLYLIEAVHSANPVGEMRKRTLEHLTKNCTADIVFVSAFLTRQSFRKFVTDIAWETEVWIAEAPDHLIHFNGDKFLGPHLAMKP